MYASGESIPDFLMMDLRGLKAGEKIMASDVELNDGIMLVTDGGQLIRCPVDGIRVAGRNTQGVIIFRTADDERVVSVERISEDENAGDENGADQAPEGTSEDGT